MITTDLETALSGLSTLPITWDWGSPNSTVADGVVGSCYLKSIGTVGSFRSVVASAVVARTTDYSTLKEWVESFSHLIFDALHPTNGSLEGCLGSARINGLSLDTLQPSSPPAVAGKTPVAVFNGGVIVTITLLRP